MKKKLIYLIGTLLIYGTLCSNSFGEQGGKYEVKFEKEFSNSSLNIKVCSKNNTDEEVKIILKTIVEKQGKAGTSKVIQSNGINLKAYEKKCFSKIVLDLSSEDDYRITLEAYKDKKLITKEYIRKGN